MSYESFDMDNERKLLERPGLLASDLHFPNGHLESPEIRAIISITSYSNPFSPWIPLRGHIPRDMSLNGLGKHVGIRLGGHVTGSPSSIFLGGPVSGIARFREFRIDVLADHGRLHIQGSAEVVLSDERR